MLTSQYLYLSAGGPVVFLSWFTPKDDSTDVGERLEVSFWGSLGKTWVLPESKVVHATRIVD